MTGNIAEGTRANPGWPHIVNPRADPYEKAPSEADLSYLRWYGDLLWLFVPVQQKIKEFFADFEAYAYQAGASLNAAGINCGPCRRHRCSSGSTRSKVSRRHRTDRNRD